MSISCQTRPTLLLIHYCCSESASGSDLQLIFYYTFFSLRKYRTIQINTIREGVDIKISLRETDNVFESLLLQRVFQILLLVNFVVTVS